MKLIWSMKCDSFIYEQGEWNLHTTVNTVILLSALSLAIDNIDENISMEFAWMEL